jgi:dynein heavy chain
VQLLVGRPSVIGAVVQITNERFLVYLNDMLASGNIPDLYTTDEVCTPLVLCVLLLDVTRVVQVDEIVNALAPKVKALGIVPEKKNVWPYVHRLRH